MLEESIRRIDAFRAAHPEHPIVDVQYDDLVRDPVGAVGSIYAAVDGPARRRARPTAWEAMTAYVAAHPKDSLGVHGYDLAEFGLDAARARRALRGLRRPLRRRARASARAERYSARLAAASSIATRCSYDCRSSQKRRNRASE